MLIILQSNEKRKCFFIKISESHLLNFSKGQTLAELQPVFTRGAHRDGIVWPRWTLKVFPESLWWAVKNQRNEEMEKHRLQKRPRLLSLINSCNINPHKTSAVRDADTHSST